MFCIYTYLRDTDQFKISIDDKVSVRSVCERASLFYYFPLLCLLVVGGGDLYYVDFIR